MYNTGIFVKKSIPCRYGYQRLPPLAPPLGINGGGGPGGLLQAYIR